MLQYRKRGKKKDPNFKYNLGKNTLAWESINNQKLSKNGLHPVPVQTDNVFL